MADVLKIQDEIAQDEKGAVIPIAQKNGEPYLGADGAQSTITVLGFDSKKVKTAKDAVQRRAIRSRKKPDLGDFARNRVDLAAAAVVEWSGWESGTEAFPCTPDNIRSMLGADHILEQVEAGVAGHADFFAKN